MFDGTDAPVALVLERTRVTFKMRPGTVVPLVEMTEYCRGPMRSRPFLPTPRSQEEEGQHTFFSIFVFMAFSAKHFPFGDEAAAVTGGLLP